MWIVIGLEQLAHQQIRTNVPRGRELRGGLQCRLLWDSMGMRIAARRIANDPLYRLPCDIDHFDEAPLSWWDIEIAWSWKMRHWGCVIFLCTSSSRVKLRWNWAPLSRLPLLCTTSRLGLDTTRCENWCREYRTNVHILVRTRICRHLTSCEGSTLIWRRNLVVYVLYEQRAPC